MQQINLTTYQGFGGGVVSPAEVTLQTLPTCASGFGVVTVFVDTTTGMEVVPGSPNSAGAVKIVNNCTGDFSIVAGNKMAIQDILMSGCCAKLIESASFVNNVNAPSGEPFCLGGKPNYPLTADYTPYGGLANVVVNSDEEHIDNIFALTGVNITMCGCSWLFPSDYIGTISDLEILVSNPPDTSITNIDDTDTLYEFVDTPGDVDGNPCPAWISEYTEYSIDGGATFSPQETGLTSPVDLCAKDLSALTGGANFTGNLTIHRYVEDCGGIHEFTLSVPITTDANGLINSVDGNACYALTITDEGITEGFLDQSGNPTNQPYSTGANDGTNVVLPNIQRGYAFEVCETSSNVGSGIQTITLSEDLAVLANKYVEVISGGNFISLVGNVLTFELAPGACFLFEVRGEVTTKGGNPGNDGNPDEYMVSGISAAALEGTATIDSNGLFATDTGVLQASCFTLTGTSAAYTNGNSLSAGCSQLNTISNENDQWGQCPTLGTVGPTGLPNEVNIVWLFNAGMLANGVVMLNGIQPADPLANAGIAGWETPKETTDWYVANLPNFGVYWANNFNASNGNRVSLVDVGTYYTINTLVTRRYIDYRRNGYGDGTGSGADQTSLITGQNFVFTQCPFGENAAAGTINQLLYIPSGQ